MWDDLVQVNNKFGAPQNPFVRIGECNVYCNSIFIKLADLRNPKITYVKVYYSIKYNSIILKFVSDNEWFGAFKLTKANKSVSFSSKGFLLKHIHRGKLFKDRLIPIPAIIPGYGDCWVVYLNGEDTVWMG